MTATTYSEFGDKTESLEVAGKFADEIHGKTVVITGVNRGGIGFTTAEAFASQGASTIVVAGRNPSRIEQCIDTLKQEFPNVNYRGLKLDLSSQRAVRAAAAELLSWTDITTVDVLVNNAAVMLLPERTLSQDGIEMHLATNHIGHYLFTCLIMPKLLQAARKMPRGATRVVNVSSLSPKTGSMRWSDINFDKINKDLPESEQPCYPLHKAWGAVNPEQKEYLPLEGYSQSKVANVLFGIALNRRLYEKHGVLSFAVHPGVIDTELGRHITPETRAATQALKKSGIYTIKTLGAGAATTLVAAVDPRLELPQSQPKSNNENYGAYLIDCQISDQACARAVSSDEAEKLWRLSEDLVHQKFAFD